MKINYEVLFNSHNPTARFHQAADTVAGADETVHEIFTQDQVEEILDTDRKRLRGDWDNERKIVEQSSYEKGINEGFEKASEQFHGSIQTVSKALSAAEKGIEEILESIKPHIASMAFDLAGKILEVPVENDQIKKSVIREIGKLIDELSSQVEIYVQVSGSDYDRISNLIDQKGVSHIKLQSNPKLNPGEYRIDTRNEQIAREFRKALENFRESFTLNE